MLLRRGSRLSRRPLSVATFINSDVLTIEPTTSPKPRKEASKLVFGATTTDHMLEVDWTASQVRAFFCKPLHAVFSHVF